MKLELEEETVNDAFRERLDNKDREAAAVHERKRQAAEEEARQRQATSDAARRRLWEEEHISDALRRVPYGTSGDLHLKVNEEVRAVLRKRSPDDDKGLTDRLVEAAQDKERFPMRRSKIANNAHRSLLYAMEDGELGEKAKSMAAVALQNALSDSPDEEMKETERRAVEPLIQTARHELNI